MIFRALLACVIFLAVPDPSTAQSGRVGVGGVVGATSGLSIRVVPKRFVGLFPRVIRAEAVEVIAAWTFDGYVFAQAHFTKGSDIPSSPLSFFVGPGIVTEFEDGTGFLGVSAVGGVHFFRARFEIFLHVAPYLHVLPEPKGRFTPGVGVRFYP